MNKEGLKPGGGVSYHQFEEPSADILATFKNPTTYAQAITFRSKEVTALCPLTGQPDYYEVVITYTPARLCIESKSAKMYLGSYRSFGGFIETIADKMLWDWVRACKPLKVKVDITMVPRGGVGINVIQEHVVIGSEDWPVD